MKYWLNVITFVLGAFFVALAIDGWWETAFVIVGIILIGVDFNYSPSVAEKAMRLLEAHYRFMQHLGAEIDREWRPMGGQENEAKRVIVTEIRDTIPARIQQLLDDGK